MRGDSKLRLGAGYGGGIYKLCVCVRVLTYLMLCFSCIFLRIICGSHLLLEAKGLASLSMQRGNTRNSSPIPRMLAFGGIIINEKKPTQRSLGRQQYVGITKENL